MSFCFYITINNALCIQLQCRLELCGCCNYCSYCTIFTVFMLSGIRLRLSDEINLRFVFVLTLNIKLNRSVALAMQVLCITAIPCTVCRVCHDVGVIISSMQELKLRSSLSVPGVVELWWVCISPAGQSHWFALHHWAGGKRWQRCVFWGIWGKERTVM